MGMAEITKIAASFIFVTALTILVERYISDNAALVVLLVSTGVLGYLYLEDVRKAIDWGREHRQMAIVVYVALFAIVGLLVGMWMTAPSTKEKALQEKPPTLFDLFKRDFPNDMGFEDKGLDLRDSNGETIH